MSCFFVVSAPADFRKNATETFDLGLRSARDLLGSQPRQIFRGEGMLAATFCRRDGSGGEMALEPNGTGCLLTSGTWFHRGGASDATDLLLHLREVGHTSVARQLDGTFVVVDLDVRECKVTAFNDILGTGRCYVRELANGAVALSGSSLLLAALAPADLDPLGAQEFLYIGDIYENRTLFRDVEKLGPAGSVIVTGNEVERPARYWSVAELEPESLSGPAALDAVRTALEDAARQIQRGFDNPICDLTGGYDSRTLVSHFLSASVPCSAAVTGWPSDPDVMTSSALATAAGLDLEIVPPQSRVTFDRVKETLGWTDGEYDMLSFRRISDVHLRLSGAFDLSVNGSGGELARGYRYELARPGFSERRPLDARRVARRRFATETHDASIVPSALRIDLVDHVADMVDRMVRPLHDRPRYFQLDHAFNELILGGWHGRIAASTDRIRPLASPFMFRPTVEALMATRGADRVRNLLVRRLLADNQPRWAGIALADGRLPAPLSVRNLHMALPLARNIASRMARRAGWKRSGSEHVQSDTTWRQQLWQDEAVISLLDARNMYCTEFLDAERLGDFFARSRLQDFDTHDQWSRLLTLEYALQRLASCRRALRATAA